MQSFNLIDEPWIPLRTMNDEPVTLALRETLLRAGDLWRIEDPSPLTTVALHRLLLAVLHRALEGPRIVDDAAKWHQNGFPLKAIQAYLDRWHDRFDLFDDRSPFFQVPLLSEAAKPKPWTMLLPQEGSNNTSALFNHGLRDGYEPPPAQPSEATRALLTFQTFVLGGLIKVFLTSAPGGALAQAAVVLPLGETLQETLALNLVPHPSVDHDLPIWERGDVLTLQHMQAAPSERARGFVQGYTWPNRSVLLVPDSHDGKTVVNEVLIGAGVRLEKSEAYRTDPMAAYRYTDRWGLLPIGFRVGRGFWRDFSALLPQGTHKDEIAPAVVSHGRDLCRALRRSDPPSVLVAGLSNDRAKIEQWRTELFRLPSAILTDRDVYEPVALALARAEENARVLADASRRIAQNLLARGDRKLASSDVGNLVSTLPGVSLYWSMLQGHFAGLLSRLDPGFDHDTVALFWEECIYHALDRAWQYTTRSVGTNATALRAVARAEGYLSPHMADIYSRLHGSREIG